MHVHGLLVRQGRPAIGDRRVFPLPSGHARPGHACVTPSVRQRPPDANGLRWPRLPLCGASSRAAGAVELMPVGELARHAGPSPGFARLSRSCRRR
jgi:hypothetical protein